MAPLTPPAGLRLLLERRSHHHLGAPAPDDAALELMLRAALRVPDFGHLRPYRFLAARGEGLDRLGEAMRRAALAAGQPEKRIARAPRMPHRAPLVLVVVASPRASATVPLFDQQLCAGCTVLTLQLAARALGYGGIWRSGWWMYDRGFHRELGLAEEEQIVGFLYLGTPVEGADEPGNGEPERVGDVRFEWL
ncbi:nitroreductase family protein [Pseudothauera rhizosphaerae]|uniref:Putative NAD(P)H nitroreductase n=1 Tax=Pseudothauera rhizosphaerae TaxID=2565932 RepID=A0A4S4ASE4_9RHOO|nr:nitroreductase family protein [Pseudothauera rhizosphaerae]THF62752.1 nitroreductase [Pseudothauera rhizosphaerae]